MNNGRKRRVGYTQGPWHAPGLGEIHDEKHRVIAMLVDVDPVGEDERPSPALAEAEANARHICELHNALLRRERRDS